MSRHSRTYTPRRGTGIPANVRSETIDRLYRDADGALPDFTRLDRRPPPWRRWVIIGALSTLAVLAIAAWAGFLIFKPYAATSTGTLTLAIDAPPTADVGSDIAYRIRVANGDRVPVARTTLELKLPPDFALTAADPAPTDAKTPSWNLDTLAPHSDRTITVRGRVYGAPPNPVALQVMAFYRPANFNSDFQSTASATTTLNPSPIALTITGPDHAVPGTAVTYTIAYEQRGPATLPPTAITLTLPNGFTLSNATPNRPRTDELRWPLGEFASGAKGTITLTGAFSGDAEGATTVQASAVFELAPDHRIPQVTASAATDVLGGDVSLLTTVNDQQGGVDAHPGDALRFRIAIRNAGSAELRMLTVRAIAEAPAIGGKSILDFNRITDPANGTAVGEQLGADRRRGTITWDAKSTPDLAAVKAGEQRTIDLTLPIHTPATLPGFTGSGTITFTATVGIAATGTTDTPRTLASPPLTIHVR